MNEQAAAAVKSILADIDSGALVDPAAIRARLAEVDDIMGGGPSGPQGGG
jgi:hypothetical protein